jgi:hypothetical protein
VNTTNQYEPSTHTDAIPNGSLTNPWSTFDAYFDRQKWTWLAERSKSVHEPTLDEIFAAKVPSQAAQPRCDLLGGGLGAGKSTLARRLQAEHPNSVLVDPDSAKEFIPEYAWFQRQDLDTSWLRVHDESRHIAQKVLARAINGRFDVILDTCAAGPEITYIIREFLLREYNLVVQFVDTPLDIAVARIKIAASVPGRAHFGRWAYAPESKQWQSAENPFAPPPTWEWVTDLFAGQQEFNRWQKTLTRSNLTDG